MSIAIHITIDEATPVIGGLAQEIAPERLNPRLAEAVVQLQKDHLFGLDRSRANKLGGKRTRYYERAARLCTSEARGANGFFAGTSGVGMRMKFFGGTVTPKRAKYLTIPARAEAYGKRAREFNDLRFAMIGKAPALVQVDRTNIARRGGKGAKGFKAASVQGGLVMFWLVRSARIVADESVMPSTEQYARTIEERGRAVIARAAQRRGGG